MVDYDTIRAPTDAVDVAREAKRKDETWGDFLLRCADADAPTKWTEGEIREMSREEARQAIERCRK